VWDVLDLVFFLVFFIDLSNHLLLFVYLFTLFFLSTYILHSARSY
jgi:hypothetical protein